MGYTLGKGSVGFRATHATSASAAEHALWLDCVSRAAREEDPARKIRHLLVYLETYPVGAYNRDTAERIERHLDALEDGPVRRTLGARFREVRDRHLPPRV